MNLDKIQEAKKKIENAQKDLQKQVKELFFEAVKTEVFEKNPSLDSFSWRQGTPSWCDGDPCTFSADLYGFDVEINGISQSAYEEHNERIDEKVYTDVVDCIQSFMKNFKDEDVEHFGDPVIVTIHKNGKVTTEYYDIG